MSFLKWFFFIFAAGSLFAATEPKKTGKPLAKSELKPQYEKNFQNKSFHLVQPLAKDKSGLLNWGQLFYFGSFTKEVPLKENENFIEKPVFEQNKTVKSSKAKVYQHLLKINIDNEMTVEDLLESSESFAAALKKVIYDSDIFLPSSSSGEKNIQVKAFFPFTGSNQLIDLILKSGYFIEKEKLKSLSTKYHPSNHLKVVIEARHLKLKPSLFPQIYTYDASGNKILIYSLNHSHFSEITQRGYAQFFTNLQRINIKKDKVFYCPAVELSGAKKTDLVISREDYMKLFSSKNTLKNLADGNLIFIISNNTFVEKPLPKEGEEDLKNIKKERKNF